MKLQAACCGACTAPHAVPALPATSHAALITSLQRQPTHLVLRSLAAQRGCRGGVQRNKLAPHGHHRMQRCGRIKLARPAIVVAARAHYV